MFERYVLKRRAKEVLSGNYMNILMVILMVNVTSSIVSGLIALFVGGNVLPTTIKNLAAFGVFQLSSSALSIAATALLIAPLHVGVNKYILDNSDCKPTTINALSYAFRTNYVGITAVLFAKTLIINLIMLIPRILLIFSFFVNVGLKNTTVSLIITLICYIMTIPGIMKYYDYYLLEYVLVEKPELSWKEALNESELLMRGSRFAVFKLNLSFLGWLFLGVLAAGIGIIFVLPYISATDAELYKELSRKVKT